MSSSRNIASVQDHRDRRVVRVTHASDPADRSFNLAAVALAIARDEYPKLSAEAYLRHLDSAAETVQMRLRGRSRRPEVLGELISYLYSDAGYEGKLDEYADPRNSYLNQVIERRIGSPLTLGIVFLEVGWRLGLPLEGIAFPGHFLVKCDYGRSILVLDPFFGGMVVPEGQLLERVSRVTSVDDPAAVLPMLLAGATRRDIIVRLLRNLKGLYQARADHTRLVRVADHLVHYAPSAAEERRDRGLAYLAIDADAAALRDFMRYLELRPGASDKERIQDMVEDLQSRLPPESWNMTEH